jgi:predicted metal-dependent hydrolase
VAAPSDYEAAWARRYQEWAGRPESPREAAASLVGLLVFRPRCATLREEAGVIGMHRVGTLEVEPHTQLCQCLGAACDRVRSYVKVLQQVTAQQRRLEQIQPLRRAVAEAGMCFDAGLFFEAHEHLEHQWVGLRPGSAKRQVQGIIQISVGFYHALRSSYDGAVNQLEKGLAKLADAPGEILGLDCPRFRQEVAEARRQIVARGRGRMRPALLDELPRMRINP